MSLPPERADARGILSHLNGPANRPGGSFGDWLDSGEITVTATTRTVQINLLVTGEGAQGLALFGRRLGRYGRAARVTVSW